MEDASNDFGSIAEKSPENGEEVNCREPTSGPPKDSFVYRQDVVKCSKYGDLLGIVMEVAGDSDSDSSITDDSDDEEMEERNDAEVGATGDGDDTVNMDGDDNDDSLPDGQVRLTWTDGSETTDDITNITVVDRSFLHGDYVASASDPMGQLGLVVDVNITVDLQAADRDTLKGVSSRDLKRIREFTVGDFVVFGPWLGRVDEVLDNVTVLFDDGSVCKVVKADPLRLKPVSKPLIDDTSCPYYPGQRVRAVSSSVFRTSRWLSGLWKASRLEGTVTKVETVSVVVYWIASAYLGIGANQATVPPEEQNPKKLTLLSCFSHANWQLADCCLLPSPGQLSSYADDTSVTSTEPKERCTAEHMENPTCDNIEGSGLPADVPEQDLKIQNDTVNLGGMVSSDPPNDPLDSENLVDSFCESSIELKENSKPNTTDSTIVNVMLVAGEDNGAEQNVLPECSCSSSSSVLKESTHESWPTYRKKLRKVLFKRDKRTHRRDETFERALFIVNTVTTVDVVWQDGRRENQLDSTSLIPIQSPNDHEFFPEQYVVDKTSNEVDDSSERKRVGIVRSVNSKERTVCVRWLKPISRPEDPKEFDSDEVVSAYELDAHPDYDYCYGDVVVRLPSVSVSSETVNCESPVEKEDDQDPMGTKADPSRQQADYGELEQAPEVESCATFSSLSWVGNIIGFQDGDIEVIWGDGKMSKVGPHEVYVVGREDDGDSFDGGSEVSDDGASWETVDENEMDTLNNSGKEGDLQMPTDENVEKENSDVLFPDNGNAGRNGPLSVPLAALGYVTRLATGLFARGRKQMDISGSDGMNENEANPQEVLEVSEKAADEGTRNKESEASVGSVYVNDAKEACGNMAGAEENDVKKDVDSSASMEEYAGSTGADSRDGPHSFKHFDIVQNPLDHHFLGDSGQGTCGKKWVKKVQQEWNILEKNLPDAIYVRVFEERMDLIRAVIIGACGTPYQDGLFFFDFHLPPEYPQVPPSAYYHSGGLRVNPNLYVDGKVCLSLLNTWTGKGNEVWDPSSSSILQVLVSLQGLVLNSKPYFNEAGYEKQVGTVEGEKNSLPYNENTYLLNLKSILYLLRRPPMHFEGFVRDHFCKRGHYILKACEAYMGGSSIGSLTSDACSTEKSREHSCSVGFKLTLAKILPRLSSALREVGVNCDRFEYLHNLENMQEC
ncbi:probable ubiquitin-conjugating enzyme E2 23 isoform X2 [Typha latifolia]